VKRFLGLAGSHGVPGAEAYGRALFGVFMGPAESYPRFRLRGVFAVRGMGRGRLKRSKGIWWMPWH
jgi:hypothetical protein